MEMEKVKDPAMLLACVSLLSTMGGGTYFYKQLEAIRLDQERMTNQLAKLTERVADIEVSNNGRKETMTELNNQIKEMNRLVTTMPRLDTIATHGDLDVFDRDFDELILDLQERNIEVNRASKESQSRASGRYNKRYVNHRESTDEVGKGRRPKSDDRPLIRPYTEPKTPLYQSLQPPYQSSQPTYQSSQPTYQSSQPTYHYQQQQQQGTSQQVLQPQPFEEGDDLELINHVRKQNG
jgi:hypothetical protein